MLRNPDPGDWLMIRRDYKASSYSPLNQVTRNNVQDLRLVWQWAMNEGGTNQPAPLVHDGIIYLNNTGNILQALDGRTGDLIWESATAARRRRIRCAAFRFMVTAFSWPPATDACWLSTRAPARRFGNPTLPMHPKGSDLAPAADLWW